MGFDSGYGFDVSPFNRSILSSYSYTGLTCLKCANWAEGPTHGGIATEYTVDTLWDYVSEYENLNGASDYRKVFVKNFGESSTGSCVIRPVFTAPNDLVGRLSCILGTGTASDNMSNKPADGTFGSSLTVTIDAGVSQPIWLKRTITAGTSPASSYLGIGFAITVSES
jgi:hypothetical protein